MWTEDALHRRSCHVLPDLLNIPNCVSACMSMFRRMMNLTYVLWASAHLTFMLILLIAVEIIRCVVRELPRSTGSKEHSRTLPGAACHL